MNPPFFSTPERIEALRVEAGRWPGTPFINYGAVAGGAGGASCHCLAAAMLAGAGWRLGEALPRIPVNYASQTSDSVMLPWLRARPEKLQEIVPADLASILPGDLIVAKLDLCEHHLGTALPAGVVHPDGRVLGDGLVLHTLRRIGAHVIGIGDPFFTSNFVALFRPLDWEAAP